MANITLKKLYYMIWEASNKRSYISGTLLEKYYNSAFQLNIFAHVLPKEQNRYPHFKFYAKNIRLLTPMEHHYWDTPMEEREKKWDKMIHLEEELKQEYNILFPKDKHGIRNYKYTEEEVAEIIGPLNEEFFLQHTSF